MECAAGPRGRPEIVLNRGGCCLARERPRADPARPPRLRHPSIVSSWRPERVSVSSPAARAIAPPRRGAQTDSTLGLRYSS